MPNAARRVSTKRSKSKLNKLLIDPQASGGQLLETSDWWGYQAVHSSAGVHVSPPTAFQVAAFWSAVDLISGDIARLPLQVMRVDAAGNRLVAADLPAHQLAAVQPNPWMSPQEFWCTVAVQMLVYGQAYVAIERRNNGQPQNLLPLFNHATRSTWMDGEFWVVTELPYHSGTNYLVPYRYTDVLRIRGMTLNNYDQALALWWYARDTLALALASQGYAAQFFKAGGRMGGTLHVPANTSPEAKKTIESGFAQAYEGADNAFKTVVLRDGVKFLEGQHSPDDAQLTAARDHQVAEVARFFKLHPSKLGLNYATSYGSLAEANKDYLDRTLSSWLAKICGEYSIKMLQPGYRTGRLACKHDTSELLWLDPGTRSEYYAQAIANRWMSPNEVRQREGLPPGPPELDQFINPATTSFNQDSSGELPPPDDDDGTETEAEALLLLLEDRTSHAVKQFTGRARRAAAAGHRYVEWLDNRSQVDFENAVKGVELVCQAHHRLTGRDAWPELVAKLRAELLDRYRHLAEESTEAGLRRDVERLGDQVTKELEACAKFCSTNN